MTVILFDGFAQNKSCPVVGFDLGVDLMSRYVWRGTQFGGNTPSIQPYTAFSVGGFEFGTWAAYSLGGDNTGQEFDLSLSYTFANEMFTVLVSDYYFPDNTVDYNYFDYNQDNTGHVFEGTFSFNGTENFPLTILGAVNFYGADPGKIESDPTSPDFNEQIGIQYSSYFELGYSAQIGDVAFEPFIGATITDPKEEDLSIGFVGEEGYYGTGPGVVNLGFTASKEISITEKFALPIQASIITNPQAEKVFFVFGFSF